jgi:hypothetical protein
LFWFLNDKSKVASYRMEEQGDPHHFPSQPTIGRNVWEHLQKWKASVLLRCKLVEGNAEKWDNFVAAIDDEQREKERLIQVLTRLRTSDRAKLAPKDVKRVWVPNYSYMRKLMDELGEGDDFETRMHEAAEKYRNLLSNPSYISELDIHQVLDILESYHQVELLTKPWSREQFYKCTCADSHRDGVCDHSVMFSLFVDKSIAVPARFVTTQVAKRRKPGRPAEPKPQPKTRRRIEFEVRHCGTDDDDETEVFPPPQHSTSLYSTDPPCLLTGTSGGVSGYISPAIAAHH